jgi:hypothetical protein
MKIHLNKVKNRYRCWGARLDSSILELLDVRDIKREKIRFELDESTRRIRIRLSSEMESNGSNIRKPKTASNSYLCSFTMDNDMNDGEYTMIESYEDGDYIFYEFEFKN